MSTSSSSSGGSSGSPSSDLCSEYDAVNDSFAHFVNTLTAIQDAVQEKWIAFRAHRAQLERKVSHCNDIAKRWRKVSLDIGGTVFNTTEETLLKEKDSFFWAMLHSGQWAPDQPGGQYFIDRSPDMFSVILEYLRSGKTTKFIELTKNQRAMLEDDLDFYGISSFPRFSCAWDVTASGREYFHFIDNGRIAIGDATNTKVTEAAVQAQPLSTASVDSLHWTITVTKMVPGAVLAFGKQTNTWADRQQDCANVAGGGGGMDTDWPLSIAVHHLRNGVAVGMAAGDIKLPGQPVKPFISWPPNSNSRTVHFMLDTSTWDLTISALNDVYSMTVKVEPVSEIVPGVVTNSLKAAFSIK
eukprot:TRINITY_DN67802_c3_g2_i1.p1 TRINITY_DN67802_c3_g2~~TRINITY_DN67802_c3_g2_i1.p1  ORF type:complete len:355 (+),score=38.23 TRINITY_DN67802_c3_g2_i1:136-1200(+)